MTFALKSSEVDVTDDHFNTIIFYTDGRQLPKDKKQQKDDANKEAVAHWEGNQLITDEKTPQGAKMSRTFELSPDGRQCFETVHVDRGKSKGQLTVRFVYNVEGASTQPEHDTDPNVPVMKRKAETPEPAAAPGSQPDAQSTQPAPAPAPDPDQPVMRRRTDSGSSPQ